MILLRRLAAFLITLLLASAAIFTILEVLPGDPASLMLGTQAQPDTLAALRTELGLDRPALARYLAWLGGLASGDLGTSYTYRVPVAQLLGERLAITIPLATLALLFSTIAAIPLGAWSAARHGRMVDRAVLAGTQLGIAVPNFWIGLLLILGFSTGLGWFSAGGFPGWAAPVLALKALLLPALSLAIPQAAILTRVVRSAVLEIMDEDFVRTARAKGLTRGQALRRHVLPNAMIPVVTVIGLQFSFLVAGAILVENVFTLPGLGRLVYQAMAQRDLVVIKDCAMLLAAMVILVNFLVDLTYAVIDPRLRAR